MTPRRIERPLAAGLLNASGLGLGYLYLRRPGAMLAALLLTGLLLLVATWGAAASRPLVWLAVFALWWAVMIAHGARLAARDPEPPPGGPISRLVPFAAGVLALVLVAGAVVWYRASAADLHEQALAAHRDGDCATATRLYQGLNGAYQASLSPAARDAGAGIAACAPLVAAERHLEEGEVDLAIEEYENYRAADDPLWTGAEAALAGLRMDRARGLAETARGAGTLDRNDVVAALDAYQEVLDHHPDAPEAAAVPAEVEEMYTASTSAGAPCELMLRLDVFDGLDHDLVREHAEEAAAGLPDTLYECAEEEAGDADFDRAETLFTRFVEDYPDDPRAGAARDRLAGFGEERETAEIRDQIDDLIGTGGELPPPTASGSAPSGTVRVSIVNGTSQTLELLYDGPETGNVTLAVDSPCGISSYPGEGTTLTLAPGEYRMVVRTVSGDVTPYTGTWNLSSGTSYSECYYITGW